MKPLTSTSPLLLLYALLRVSPLAFGLLVGLIAGAGRELLCDPLIDAEIPAFAMVMAYLIPAVAAGCHLFSQRSVINQYIQDIADDTELRNKK